MKSMRRLAVTLGLLAGITMVFGFARTPAASAATQRSQTSYCGIPAHSVAQLRAGWKLGTPLSIAAEQYMKVHRGYYHIHLDQGLQNYLHDPHIQMAMTPRSYKLQTNTYCPGARIYMNYRGLLSYGHHNTPSWCTAGKTTTRKATVKKNGKTYTRVTTTTVKSCIPIVKDYCRNLVRGKPFHKIVRHVRYILNQTKKSPAVKPTAPTGNCNNINSPGGIACSTVTYVNVCGTQQVYNGDQKDLQTWINNYVADHCAPTVTTTVCADNAAVNYGSTGACVYPAPKCTDTSASNYGGTLPCVYPPPKCTDKNASNYGGSLPCTYPPPPATCKVLSVETPEEMYNDGETRPIRVQVTSQNGHSITLTYTLTNPYGTFYNPKVTFTSTGSDTEQATYTAPNDQSSVGQSTMIDVSCHDNTTGSDGTPNHSDSFQIKAVPQTNTGTRP